MVLCCKVTINVNVTDQFEGQKQLIVAQYDTNYIYVEYYEFYHVTFKTPKPNAKRTNIIIVLYYLFTVIVSFRSNCCAVNFLVFSLTQLSPRVLVLIRHVIKEWENSVRRRKTAVFIYNSIKLLSVMGQD